MGTGPSDDYYALLGVETDADISALRTAWRRLVLRWHPDRAGHDTTVIFQKIAAAYAVLSDPDARAAYDRRLGINPKPRARQASARTAAPAEPMRRRAPGVMLSRLSRPLESLLAMGVARHTEEAENEDIIELFLDADEVTQGGMVTISMRVPVRCSCIDNGVAACVRCGSRGTVEDRYSAWLAVPPEVVDGTVLVPSARLPGMLRPVSFRVRVA